MVKGWCMKCHAEREIGDAKQVKMKNGRPAIKGKCTKCDCGMYKIGKM